MTPLFTEISKFTEGYAAAIIHVDSRFLKNRRTTKI